MPFVLGPWIHLLDRCWRGTIEAVRKFPSDTDLPIARDLVEKVKVSMEATNPPEIKQWWLTDLEWAIARLETADDNHPDDKDILAALADVKQAYNEMKDET